MLLLPLFYYSLFPVLKYNNIRRTRIKNAMDCLDCLDCLDCPQCKDFKENSAQYAFNRLSAEIALEADSYAIKMTEAASYPTPDKIDLYMMYYRIEYTRLHALRKGKYVDEYQQTISSKYSGNPDLCAKCKIPDSYDFNKTVSFCFHLPSNGESCPNCEIGDIKPS